MEPTNWGIQCLKNLNFSGLRSKSALLFGYSKLTDFNRRRDKLKTNEQKQMENNREMQISYHPLFYWAVLNWHLLWLKHVSHTSELLCPAKFDSHMSIYENMDFCLKFYFNHLLLQDKVYTE